MIFRERLKLYKKASLKWGSSSQIIVAIEELSELTNQLAKHLNGKCKDMAHIVDELADSRIMIEQVEFVLDLEDRVKHRMKVKLNRLQELINKNQGELNAS